LTGAVGRRIVKVIAGAIPGRADTGYLLRRCGRLMSSEHAIEQVPLSEIREGDMLQDPKSGNWIKVTRTGDDAVSVAPEQSEQESTAVEEYRVYYGDGGEEIDSRFVSGLVNRQVRE
jgi:hypothetical protein